MKVTLPKDYRKIFTLEELDIARKIIKEMKDDEFKPEDYAETAVNHASWQNNDSGWSCIEMIRASAEICKNGYEFHAYGDDYENLDIWVSFLAKTCYGFVEGGAYLTDIWKIGNGTDYSKRFYIRKYKEV